MQERQLSMSWRSCIDVGQDIKTPAAHLVKLSKVEF